MKKQDKEFVLDKLRALHIEWLLFKSAFIRCFKKKVCPRAGKILTYLFGLLLDNASLFVGVLIGVVFVLVLTA